MPGPLSGIRILEVASVILGPWASQILGDLGADVIKIEPPGGDTTRDIGPQRNPKMSAMYLACNRNKRSLVLDLKKTRGLDILLELCKKSDVLLHNLRPVAAKRLGLSYENVHKHNPRIIFCGTYGYRSKGPYAEYPAYDDIVQAASSIATLQQMAGCEPHYAPSVIADKTTSQTVVYAITSALFHRERSGEGQSIEVPMFENMVANIMTEHLSGKTFEPPLGASGYPRVLSHFRKPHKTKDGYLAILPHTDAHWQMFLNAANRMDVLKNPKYNSVTARTENIDQLYKELANIIATRTNAEWLEILDPKLIPIMELNHPDDLLSHPQLTATDFWKMVEHPTEGLIRQTDIPVTFSKSNPAIRLLPPQLGEHSAEILREIGLTNAEIKKMLDEKITFGVNGTKST